MLSVGSNLTRECIALLFHVTQHSAKSLSVPCTLTLGIHFSRGTLVACGGNVVARGNSLLNTPNLFKYRPTLPHCPTKTLPQLTRQMVVWLTLNHAAAAVLLSYRICRCKPRPHPHQWSRERHHPARLCPFRRCGCHS